MSPREIRLQTLRALRQRVDDEITILEATATLSAAFEPKRRPRSRKVIPDCGTESAYQRHAHYGDTAKDGKRVTCADCLCAHAAHERLAEARRRLGVAS